MKIEDGTGKGYVAKVTANNRLLTRALTVSHQHHISDTIEEAYQVVTSAGGVNIAASKQNILLVENTSDTRDMVITYIRLETIGAAAASASAFWTMEVGGLYSSGGTAVTPVNMHIGSSKNAQGLFYDGNGSAIVTTGTFNEIDRLYKANDQVIYRKEGSIVIPKNQSLLITHTGSTAAGVAYARVSFFYDDINVE